MSMLATGSASPLHETYSYTGDSVVEQAGIDTRNWDVNLHEQAAKNTPIQCLPFEILSDIFILNSQMEVLAPVTISEVCHSWRSSILSIPRAWSYIWVDEFRRKHNHRYVSIFLERSNPTLLHLYIRPGRGFDLAYSVTEDILSLIISSLHRLKCLHISDRELKRIVENGLPNLSRLVLSRGTFSSRLSPSLIDKAQLPQLRWLKSYTGWSSSTSLYPEFPPLQHLSLTIDSSGMNDIIRSCAASLKSLELRGYRSALGSQSQPFTIYLPVLRSLVCLANIEYSPWPIDAATPNLICYEDCGITKNVHTDVATVKYYRAHIIPNLSSFVSLRLLQLAARIPNAHTPPESQLALASDLLDLLQQNSDICSLLETVEMFMPAGELETDIILKQEELIARSKEIRPCVTFLFTTRLRSMPRLIEYATCNNGMPCLFI